VERISTLKSANPLASATIPDLSVTLIRARVILFNFMIFTSLSFRV